MKRLWIAAAIAASLAASPAAAQDRSIPKSLDEAAEATRQALEGVMNTFRGLVESFPAYEAPEILDNGDILIRRKRSEANPPAPKPKAAPRRDEELKT